MENERSSHFDRCPSRRAAMPALVAVVAALSLYAITLGGSYVYDDTILHEDPRFTDPALWSEFWTKDYMPGAVDKLYRPLTCLTLAIEFWLHGDRPWLFHLVNCLLHAGAAAAVAELARRLMGIRVALAAGLLFAVHPVHVEAVAGLVGRAELLSTLAIVGAAVLFLKPMTAPRAAAIAGCFVIAIFSKEQGILLPAILLALVPFRRQSISGRGAHGGADSQNSRGMQAESLHHHSKVQHGPRERRSMKILIASLCLIAAAYLIFREQLLGFDWDRDKLDWAANPLIRSGAIDRLLMPFVLLGRYVLLLIAPLTLSLDYGSHVIGWTVNWGQPYFYLGAATFCGWVTATIWTTRRRQWAALFCLLAMAISYGMISNSIILIGTIFGERLMYLPSVFFIILLAAGLARLLRPALFAGVVLLLVTLGSIRTFTYARLWNDPLDLYLANLHDHPQSMHLHGLVVDRYLKQGDLLVARKIAEDCVLQIPDNWHSYEMCVAVDLQLHDYDHAKTILAGARPYPQQARMEIVQLRTTVENAKTEQEKAKVHR